MEYDINKAAAKLGISEKSLKSHINSFSKDFQSNCNTIRVIMNSGEYEKIYGEFHKLKSTFKMISADKAVLYCQAGCDNSISEEAYPYVELFDKISESLESIISIINR